MDERRRSGTGTGLFLILVALTFLIGPIVPGVAALLNPTSQFMLMGFGLLLLLFGAIIITIVKLYVKTAADEAFVRTGMGGQQPIIDGGAIVIPVVHNVIPVSLQTMRLDVERSGSDALITGDNLRADVEAEFYIKVQKKEEDVLAAATSLGQRSIDAESVKTLVFQKLVSALRTVAATRSLKELHGKRDDFAEAVQQIVEKDLAHNGLTLESVTISRLDQTPPNTMRGEENVFDAQGLRTIAEITQAQRIERNRIERVADQEVKAQDVERDKFIYQREVDGASAAAARDRDILKARAQAKQEADTVTAEQQRLAGLAQVEKDKGIQVAEVEKNTAIQVADQERERAVQQAEIARRRAIEIAEREKQIAIAVKEKEQAEADAQRFAADTTRERERQAVFTMETTEAAERERRKTIIDEQAAIEKEKLRRQMEADVVAYREVKLAEGEQEAAQKQALARLTLAEADKNARTLAAQAEQATQIVPVEVEREQVEVERARVNVRREELKNQAEFDRIAHDLRIELARIEAEKEVRIEAARAFGTAMASARMTVWGSPETVTRMSEAFFRGQQNGAYLEGIAAGTPEPVKQAAVHAVQEFGTLGAALIKKLTGVEVDPATLADMLKTTPHQPDAAPPAASVPVDGNNARPSSERA